MNPNKTKKIPGKYERQFDLSEILEKRKLRAEWAGSIRLSKYTKICAKAQGEATRLNTERMFY